MTVLEWSELLRRLEPVLERNVSRVPACEGSDTLVHDVLVELQSEQSELDVKSATREAFRLLGRRYSELRGTREALNDLVGDQLDRGGQVYDVAELYGLPKADVLKIARGRR